MLNDSPGTPETMDIKRNDSRDLLLSPVQMGRIKMLLYLADGRESLQLSDMRIYRAWKELFFDSVCEMEELGLLKSIRTYPLGINKEEREERSCCRYPSSASARSTSTNLANGANEANGVNVRLRAGAKERVDRPSDCTDDCNQIEVHKAHKEKRYMRKNTDKNKKRNKSNTRDNWDAWDVSGKAIQICPVLNWLAKQESDRITPPWLNKAWKSFLFDMLCQLEAEGLIKVSDGQASRTGD